VSEGRPAFRAKCDRVVARSAHPPKAYRLRRPRSRKVPPGTDLWGSGGASDIPPNGKNKVLMIEDDWPVFADDEVRFLGQTIALAVGPDRTMLRKLAGEVTVRYREGEPAYTIDDALALKGGPVHGGDNAFVDYGFEKGSWNEAEKNSTRIVEEVFETGFQ